LSSPRAPLCPAPQSSLTISYLRESDLEGAILQHTQAVDYYLSTAPKWRCPSAGRPSPGLELQALFRQDVARNYWSAFAQPPTRSLLPSLVVSRRGRGWRPLLH
jgi:hypothetical protein